METSHLLHPYYPLGVVIKGYVSNTLSTGVILMYFSGLCLAVLLPSFVMIKRTRSGLPQSQLCTAMWFVLCAYIHLVVEGYFVFNHFNLASDPSLMGQMWKEYALSDSRYLTSDTFTVCMETITTVFWGPLSLLCAYYIATDHPARHPLLGSHHQLGAALRRRAVLRHLHLRGAYAGHGIFAAGTGLFLGPWGYYVLLNSFWIVIPSILLRQSARETTNTFRVLKPVDSGKVTKLA